MPPAILTCPLEPEPVMSADSELEQLEIELLLEAVLRRYGYDFRDYAHSSLRRRIMNVMHAEGIPTVSALQDRVLHNRSSFERFLLAISVNVTSLFRDPGFFLAFREKVVPILRTYPFIRIWHAGCSTGEEVYSMAILLQEEGLYDKCRIYATDMDDLVLRRAKEGIVPVEEVVRNAGNYLKAGGKKSLDDYYTMGYGSAIFRSSLRENVLFSQHNLATDGSFNEFNVILCRNVMIYFNRKLQLRVLELLRESLVMLGILGLGSKESLRTLPVENKFEVLESGCKLYRRIA